MKKNIVVIGGGNGSAVSINAVKDYTDVFNISAVISMSDSGGSSGRLRREFKTLPPGDIMRAVLAMSPYDFQTLKQIFYRNRFSNKGKLQGHNLGNLFLALSAEYNGDFMHSVKALEQAVEAVGHVYPATLDQTDLVAELSNGKVIKTEAKIDCPDYDRRLRIKKAWLEPKAKIHRQAKTAIEKADYIIIGPGSLYTSVIAVLAVDGIKQAIAKSKAKLIGIVGNAYTINGETGPTKLSECIKEGENYLLRKLDFIVVNNHALNKKEINYYKSRKWALCDFDFENLKGRNIVKCDYERFGGGLSAEKLGRILLKILNIKKYGD